MAAGDVIVREALRRHGLSGADLDAAVLAYKIANNLPVDNATEAEQTAQMKRLVGVYAHDARQA